MLAMQPLIRAIIVVFMFPTAWKIFSKETPSRLAMENKKTISE